MAAKLGGKTGGKYNIGQNADINVTPFVDIMLVLLIIFMVTIPPATISIKIDLPPPTPGAAPKKPPVWIEIQQDHHIWFAGQPTSLATLGDDIASRLGASNPTDEVILIHCRTDVRYEEFMDVVNKLQTDGYYKVALILENAS
jgi:biopolymer transport protein ExbD